MRLKQTYKLQNDITPDDLARLQSSKVVAVDTELTGLEIQTEIYYALFRYVTKTGI